VPNKHEHIGDKQIYKIYKIYLYVYLYVHLYTPETRWHLNVKENPPKPSGYTPNRVHHLYATLNPPQFLLLRHA